MLALKGGTAINLTVFNLPRLSVDIDMDFSQNLTREETRIKRERINELLSRYMAAEGYVLKDKSKQTHALDSFVYSYTNAAGNTDNIKVEINYSLRCHTLPTVLATVNVLDAFLERFAKGHYEPEMLFDDEDILARIADHPMVSWRITRIRREQHER
ncbi:MAG: nucleotidyl transferase AbiEii/AbiGii toxin family protein [Propionibacteriaceae bacterium]|nr:nucleotidyl transferase AbiEii/AbiGii toxin family protein [Propionibacteriaceae bacterium]